MQTLAENIQGVIAIDEKTIRNSADLFQGRKASHIVLTFAAENDIIPGQLKTAEKSNEITAIPELLNTLKLKECIVTIDAMACQTQITKTIRDQKGAYAIALKGNQGKLHDEAKNWLMMRGF